MQQWIIYKCYPMYFSIINMSVEEHLTMFSKSFQFLALNATSDVLMHLVSNGKYFSTNDFACLKSTADSRDVWKLTGFGKNGLFAITTSS